MTTRVSISALGFHQLGTHRTVSLAVLGRSGLDILDKLLLEPLVQIHGKQMNDNGEEDIERGGVILPDMVPDLVHDVYDGIVSPLRELDDGVALIVVGDLEQYFLL